MDHPHVRNMVQIFYWGQIHNFYRGSGIDIELDTNIILPLEGTTVILFFHFEAN